MAKLVRYKDYQKKQEINKDRIIAEAAYEYEQNLAKQQKIRKAEEDEEKLGFWGKTALVLMDLNLFFGIREQGKPGGVSDKYYVEDGKYIKQPTIFSVVPLPQEEVSEEEYIKGIQKEIKKYENKTNVGRAGKGIGEGVLKAPWRLGQAVNNFVGVTLPEMFGLTVDEKNQAIEFIEAETALSNKDNIDPERRERLNELRKEWVATRTGLFDHPSLYLKNEWNNLFGEILPTSDSKELSKRVARNANAMAQILAEYKDKTTNYWTGDWNKNIQNRQALRDEFDSAVKAYVWGKEGRYTSISDDRDLEPLSTEKVKDRNGKEWNKEIAPTGNLWSKQSIVTDSEGYAIIDPITLQPEYEDVYGLGKKLWNVTKNLATTQAGHDVAMQGISSAIEFAIPGIGVGGAMAKGSKALSTTMNMGSKMTKATKLGGQFLTSATVNQLESSQVGFEAFNEIYNEKIAEYSGIKQNDIIEELSGLGLTNEEIYLMSDARYKKKLQEWAEQNPEEAAMAYGQAKVAGDIAENTNRWLIPIQMFEIDMLVKATRGLRAGKQVSSASRNILKNPKVLPSTIGKSTFEGATEYFEETWNNYAAEKGKHLSAGENYSWADFDLSDMENIEAGVLGFVLGAGMGGTTTFIDKKAQQKQYKQQRKFIEELQQLPKAVKESVLNQIITGINLEDNIDIANQMNEAFKNGDGGKIKALGEKMLINRVVQSLQMGTVETLIDTLTEIAADEKTNEEDRVNLGKAIKFTETMADYYDSLTDKQRSNFYFLVNKANQIQVDDAITELETLLSSIKEEARTIEENNIRLQNPNNPNIDEIISQNIDEAVNKNTTVSSAKEQIDNLKFRKAQLIEQENNLKNPEFYKKLQESINKQKVEQIINNTTEENIDQSIADIEETQGSEITKEQEESLQKQTNPIPKPEIPAQPAFAQIIEEDVKLKNQKDEEVGQVTKEALKETSVESKQEENKPAKQKSSFQNRETPVDNSVSPDSEIAEKNERGVIGANDNNAEDPRVIAERSKGMDTLLLRPVFYNSKNNAHRNFIDFIKKKLKGFDELRKKYGGNPTSFSDLLEYMIRSTSAIEAEGVFNLLKEAYQEFYKENYPDAKVSSNEEMDDVYKQFYSFLEDENTEIEPTSTTSDTTFAMTEKTSEAVLKEGTTTPPHLTTNTGKELFVKGLKVAEFSFKIPFLGQSYFKEIKDGLIEFITKDRKILDSAKPFLNWNLLKKGKKVRIKLSTANNKLLPEALSQRMKLYQGGKEIENATFRDLLQNIFKDENIDELIQDNTIEQLIEKELQLFGKIGWENSIIVQRIPVNLETEGLNREEGFGKGLHEVSWWHVENIADFTDKILRENPSLTKEQAKALSRQMQEEIVKEAREKLTKLRIELIKSNNQTLNMKVSNRVPGVTLRHENGQLHTIKESNPSATIVIYTNGKFIANKKQFNTKGGFIVNLKEVNALATAEKLNGAPMMITQIGIQENEFGEIVPLYSAHFLHNNTENVTPELQEKQKKLYEVGQLINTARNTFLGQENTGMSKEVAIQILNKLAGKDVSTFSEDIINNIVSKYIGGTISKAGGNTFFTYGAYPIEYENGKYRINVKDSLNKADENIITDIIINTNGQGQEVVSFQEQSYQEYLQENLYTELQYQEVENANPDGSSIWINDPQPRIVLERDNSIDVIKDREQTQEPKPEIKKEGKTLTEKAKEAAEKTKKELEGKKPKYKIPMNFEDGTGGRKMRPEFEGKSTMELIKSGDRTATSRDRTKSYNQQDIQEGDIIEFYANSGKSKGNTVLVKVTKAPYPLSEVTAEEWSKLEGWDESRYEKLKNSGYEQFQFELLEQEEKIETQENIDTSKFNEKHLETIGQNLFGRTLNKIPLDKSFSKKDIYNILLQQFNEVVNELKEADYLSEAAFMEENSDRILGLGKENPYYRDTVRETLDIFFNKTADEEVEIQNGEVLKNYNKDSFEQAISMSLSTKVKIFLAGIKTDKVKGFSQFGNLEVYYPVDNMISALQKAFSKAKDNSIESLLQSMENQRVKSINKKTGKSPFDFYTQIAERLREAPSDLQKEIQYHLYNSPVKMSFVQFGIDREGNWTVQVLNADSKDPFFTIGDDFVNNFKQSPLIKMIDSKKYTVNEDRAKRLQDIYKELKDNFNALNPEKKADLLEEFLWSYGLTVQEGTIYSLLNPDLLGNNINLFLSGGGGLLDVLMTNLNRQLGKQSKGIELSLGENEKSSKDEGNILFFNNGNNTNSLIYQEELLTFNPQISTYIAGKTINKYEQPKFISEHFKKLVNPNDKTLLISLNKAQYSKNSMIAQMLKKYSSSGNDLGSMMDLELASLNALKRVGSSDESGDISNLSLKDYFVSLFGFFTGTRDVQELSDMERDVSGNTETLSVRLARMPFPTISDTSKLLLWKTVVYNLTENDFTFNSDGSIDFSKVLSDELFTQLIKPDLDRIEAYLRNNIETNISGHDIGAKMILGLPGLNGLLVEDANDNKVPLLKAITQSIHNPGINGNHKGIKEVISKNSSTIRKYMTDTIKQEMDEFLSFDKEGNASGLFVDNGLWTKSGLKGIDNTYLGSKGKNLTQRQKAQLAVADFVINQMVNQANIQMIFGGDLANYVQEKAAKNFVDGEPSVIKLDVLEKFAGKKVAVNDYSNYMQVYEKIGKDMGINLSKRLKQYVSPGNRLANAFGRESIQIMLNDVEVPSEQLLFYAQTRYPDKWRDYQKVIEDYLELSKLPVEERNGFTEIVDGVAVDKYEYLKGEIEKNLPEIAPFMEINNTDAQEYVTWREHLTQLIEQGRISQKDAEPLIKKLQDQTDNGVNDNNKLDEDERKVIFQPTKPLYAGLHFEDYGDYTAQRYVYVKSASFPLLPELTVGIDQLDNMRKNVEKLQALHTKKDEKGNITIEKTVRVSFNSANKVGAIKNAAPVSELYRELSDIEIEAFEKKNGITLHKENFSIQQDKPFHSDIDIQEGVREQINMGTQIEDILLSHGINQIEEKVFPNKFDKRLLEELEIEVENGNVSGIDLGKIYTYIAEQQQKLLSQKLLNKFGIKSFSELTNTNIEAYEKIAKELNQKLSNRQDQDGLELVYKVKDNGVLKYFNYKELIESGLKAESVDFKIPIWMLPNSTKFESVLNSIVNNNSINLKISGFAGPVASQAGFKTTKKTLDQYYKEGGDKGIIFTDKWDGDSLKSSRYENGELQKFQVLVPNKFRITKTRPDSTTYQEQIDMADYVKDGVVDTNKIPEELLEMFSFRIPTSSHQSGSLVEIVGFLPHNSGDLVIVPGESTVQIGEDYDIDTRFFYMYNTINDENGNLRKVSSEDVKTFDDIQKLRDEYRAYKDDLFEKTQSINSTIWNNNKELIIELGILKRLLKTAYNDKAVNKVVDDMLNYMANDVNAVSSEVEIAEIQAEIERLQSIILPTSVIKTEQEQYNQELKQSLEMLEDIYQDEKDKLYLQIKRSNKLREQYIENQIISTYVSVFSSQDNEVTSLINQALNTKFAENTAEAIDAIQSRKTSGFSVFKPLYQQEVMNLGAAGKLGIGVHSNWVTWNAILQQYSTKENPIAINGLNLRFGNLHTDGTLGKIHSDSFAKDKNGNSLKPDYYTPRPISVVNMENQNSSTDNQKLLIMGRRNENRHTINAFALMCNLGLDSDGLLINGSAMSYPSLFISQPIIKDYVRLMEYYSSITTDSNESIRKKVKDELKKLYGGQLKFDENDRMRNTELKEDLLTQINSRKLYKELSNPTQLLQWAIFENFEDLDRASQEMLELQLFFNIESDGLGISFFNTINKKEFLEKTLREKEESVSNISSLIGKFVDITEEERKPIEQQKTREQYINEGYIEISPESDILIKPETYFGHKIVNSITQGYNLWKNIFPFDEQVIKYQIEKIIENTNVFPGSTKETELKYKILRNLKDYTYSFMNTFFGTMDLNQIREELFLDIDGNESLGAYLQKLKRERHEIMDEPFFRDLGIVLKNGNEPTLITYNRNNTNAIDKNEVYKVLRRYHKENSIIKLNNKPATLNGKGITYKELIKKLLQYSLLSNQENGAIGFRNHFPLEIFEEYGISDKLTTFASVKSHNHSLLYDGNIGYLAKMLGSIDENGFIIYNTNNVSITKIKEQVEKLNTRNGSSYLTVAENGDIEISGFVNSTNSSFIKQYFQHNIEDVRYLPKKIKEDILDKTGAKNMAEVASFYARPDMNLDYVQADGALFELGMGGVYRQINQLGGFGVNEFNAFRDNNYSMYDENNVIAEYHDIDNLTLDKRKEDITNREDLSVRKALSEYLKADGKFKQLVELLLPHIDENLMFEYTELPQGVNGVYDNGKIYISEKISQNDIIPTILEEVLHNVTTNTFSNDFIVDVANGELKLTFSENAPASSRTMAQVYKAGWDAIKAHLVEKLGSEEKALETINNLINKVDETRKALNEGKQHSLTLESEEENLTYRASNFHEFLAGMFFDPEFQEILNNTEYKQSKKSIFQKFIDVLSRVIFPKVKDNSVLKAGIQALTDSLKEKEQQTTKKGKTELEKNVEKTEEIENQAQKLINETNSKEEGKNLMSSSSDNKTQPTSNFQGYKGRFEDKGKGTPEGDGKDKAMREVATTSITEVKEGNTESSSYTTSQQLPWNMFKAENGVVMLARNSEFKNKPLSKETIDRINIVHQKGAEFVVGDMPGVDTQFIDYLQEIGAKFTIYHTGDKSRIIVDENKQQPEIRKTFYNSQNKELKAGSVVTYNGNKYIVWRINDSNKVQLIKTDGTKFSGTPLSKNVVVEGNYVTTEYNGTNYIITDNNNIYSTASGTKVYEGDDNSSIVQKNRIIEKAEEESGIKKKPLFSPNKNQNTMSNIKIKNQQFTETIFDILRDMGLGQRYTDGNWSYQKFKINNGNKFGEFGKGAETVRNQKKIEAVLELLGVGKAAIFNEHSNYIELSFIPYTNDKFKDSVFRKDNRDKKRIISLLKFLSAKTGVEFEEITREQADRHTKRRNKNFKIRGANIAGKAYIVTSGGDNATSEIAAEEMLHPLVEFLHRENGKLYNQLLLEARKSFPTLFAETTANYGEIGRFYEDKDGQIRLRGSNTIADRELVTQALARIFDNKWEDVDDSQRQSFKDLIIEFLNIVKEWFSQWVTKKSDGTVEFNLKDLPETTTLNELVDLLNTKLDVILGFENVMEDMENSVRYNKINEQNTTIPDIISEIEDNIC